MIYKINFLSIFKILSIVTLIFILVFLIISDKFEIKTFLISFFLIVGIESIYLLFKKLLVKIEINNNSIFFYYKFFLFKNIVHQYEFNGLSYSNKYEYGAKGVKSKELRFYQNNSVILKVRPGLSGWSEDTIDKIENNLKSLNMNEKQ